MDELNGLDNTEGEVNEPVTESSEEVTDAARLEEENKNLRDGNSRLGREFKAYKEDNEDRYNTLLDKISEIKYQSPPTAAEKEDDLFDLGGSYDDDSVTDSKRMEKMVEAKVQKMEEDRSRKRDKYIDEYTKEVRTLGLEEDGHTYEAILKSMEGLPGYSENGKLDAQRNYEIAERNYYKNMYKQTQNPATAFRGEKAGGAVGGSTAMSSRTASEPDIAAALNDEHVQAYMKRRKKDEKFVKKAMANKSPMSGTMKL
jgi:hypothetical protein